MEGEGERAGERHKKGERDRENVENDREIDR